MIFALIAGILNSFGTIFLKISNQSIPYIFTSISLYTLNFYFFRIALKSLKPSTAYCILIMSTLIVLKIFEFISMKNTIGISEIVGLIFLLGAVYSFT